MQGNWTTVDVTRGECAGDGSYTDLRVGADVRISDSGDTLAVGRITDANRSVITNVSEPQRCVFDFRVNDVPDSDHYTVDVSNRDGPTYSRDELEDQNWQVSLTLGD